MTMADNRSERSVTGLLGRDLTDWGENRHDVISELRRHNAELAEAVRARDQFIAVAAHELRNPMAALYLRVQQLARIVQSATEPDRERLVRELARLTALMEPYVKRASMLLDVARITAATGTAPHP